MENYCTIYSHEVYFDAITSEIQKIFPKGKITVSDKEERKILHISIKEGLFKPKKEFQISYRERMKPSYQILEIDSPLTQNLSGMLGYVSSFPEANTKIKELLLQKIQTLNSELAIISLGNLNDELTILTQNICQSYEGLIFSQPKTNISKSEVQHFLDKDLNLILDINGNSEIDHLEVKINSIYFDRDQTKITEDQKKRKVDNEAILEVSNIKINKNLPVVESEEDTSIRSPKEIAERVTLLAVTNMVAFGNISGEEALEYLDRYTLLEKATPKELDFLKNPTDDAKSYETWKCECIWVLMWALAIIENLGFPDHLADLNKIPSEKYPIGEGKDPNLFINAINTSRSKQEILDANDLYYRLDWACVDARIKGEEIKEVNPGIVYERHYALNWLINYMNQDWDNVSCDT
ncbi:DUF4272 domain-containing protein [Aquimarina aquimarini]|uniref:DUF4272 domain-containing protein n=1 Tax=Aquimarina aquimarini TaxID=1191734 RepID=UPI0019029D9E|nr:DUF4272 domain-containing protein [Aquimarina aquimarini]